jgi:putative DeoR family transcriptional regulator (stage III sporulation protein D)
MEILKMTTMTNGIRINQKIKNRVLEISNYFLNNMPTVRETALKFKVSKSTVHMDVTDRLAIINPELHKKVKKVLDYHTSIRHLRGGEASKINRRKKLSLGIG